jgi:hypothetical protein
MYGSAKIRTGGPKDDRKVTVFSYLPRCNERRLSKQDLEDAKLVSETWTGVVPVSSVAEEPQGSKYAPALIPEHVRTLK